VKKRKGLFVLMILAIILLVDVVLFGPQILAIVEELPHGFHRDIHGIRFHTPIFYTSSTSDSYDQYDFMTMQSPTRQKDSMITVDFQRHVGGPDKPLSPEMQKRAGLHMAGQRDVNLAGRAGNCFEYTGTLLEINCNFGPDLRIRFFGSPNSVADFYSFMSKAESLPRTN
jgi:hypothetical protein